MKNEKQKGGNFMKFTNKNKQIKDNKIYKLYFTNDYIFSIATNIRGVIQKALKEINIKYNIANFNVIYNNSNSRFEVFIETLNLKQNIFLNDFLREILFWNKLAYVNLIFDYAEELNKNDVVIPDKNPYILDIPSDFIGKNSKEIWDLVKIGGTIYISLELLKILKD